MEPAADIDRLFSLPLDDFTAARNDIAARLMEAGLSEDSRRVAALRKPTVSAWAVNQLARRSKDTMRDLLSLRDEVERAASTKESRSVIARRRSLIADLLRDAAAILTEAGRKPTPTTSHRIADTLLAASTGIEAGPVAAGLLERDVIPSSAELSATETEQPATRARSVKTDRIVRAAADAETLATRREAEAERAEAEAQRATELATHLRELASKAREKAIALRAEAQEAASDDQST